MSKHPAPDAQRWERTKAVFDAALECPTTERSALVARETADDPDLRRDVESLLQSHDASGDFMETPAATLHLGGEDQAPIGGLVGPYRLVREIGRGGMGTVYLAARDDGEFRRQVAIKLVRRGMDTDLILSRFRHERQILAGLHHPNIARLLDGGTTADGRPYFVMEYIDGEPIHRYCERHAVSLADRLALFRAVCGAVQYAHQNLIVHRDIKASNILVTEAGVPKLLDFGIAKLLDPQRGPLATATDTLHALTPEYASPEQIRGEPVTTATDVYSLGVLLYELLAGSRPYSSSTGRLEDIARVVCDTEPMAPSAAASVVGREFQRALRGDLDTIVLMAMRKEPHRRYASAEQLSEDLRRHLAGLPVIAHRDTLGYRADKFIRRNRVGLAAASLVVASLVGGLAVAIWQARAASIARTQAERRFNEVRTLATSFLFELHDAIVTLPGSTPVRALLVKRALASLDGLARESQNDPGLQRELAVAYQRVGDVQGNSYDANLGDTDGASKSYHKALELLEPLARKDSADLETEDALATSYQKVAELSVATGDLQEGLTLFDRAIKARQHLVRHDSSNVEHRAQLAELFNERGDTKGQDGIGNTGDVAGALADYRESVRLREANLIASKRSLDARVGLANSLMNLGYLAASLGEANGIDQIRRAARLLEGVVAERPNDARRQLELMTAYARLRQPLADAARYDDAIAVDRKLFTGVAANLAADSTNEMLQRNLGVFYNYLGRDLRAAGDAKAAVDNHRKSLVLATKLFMLDSLSAQHRHDVAYTRFLLAEALADTRERRAALEQYHLAAAKKLELRASEPANVRHVSDLASIHTGIGIVLTDEGDFEPAFDALSKGISFAEEALSRSSGALKSKTTLAVAYAGMGRHYSQLSARSNDAATQSARCKESLRWLQKSADIWEELKAKGILLAANAALAANVGREMVKCRGASDS